MRKIKRFAVSAMASALLAVTFTGCGGSDESSETGSGSDSSETPVAVDSIASKGFVHVEDGQVVDGEGEAVWLKGIAFGNDVWTTHTEPFLTDHDESSYKDLSEMGFNCVRFYLDYHVFEDDDNPYEYKESGFEWIDENIEWAKKYGVGLILNMHVPQGGYQSQGEGTALWSDEESQERLKALWAEFAKRYADEPTVFGYGIINEPIVPKLSTTEESVNQCRDLMQEITDAIREYDTNHIIFAERVCAVQDTTTLESDWSVSIPETQFLLDDDNTVYEFHCYDPYNFTHQDMDWANTAGQYKYYPSDEVVTSNVLNSWAGCSTSEAVEELEDGWVLYQSEPVSRTENYNIGSVTLQANTTGVGGTVMFDDVVVEEYTDGELTAEIKNLTFDTSTSELYFWAQDGQGSSAYNEYDGYTTGCMTIFDTTSDANVSGYKFELKEGCEYVIKAKVKKVDTDCVAMPRIDFSLAEEVMTLGPDYLESIMLQYLAFGEENNVPMYMGEFGAAITACVEGRGGEQWTADMIDICKEYSVHFTYHTYHENTFGLYQNDAYSLPSAEYLNVELAEVFRSKLADSE